MYKDNGYAKVVAMPAKKLAKKLDISPNEALKIKIMVSNSFSQDDWEDFKKWQENEY